MQTRVLVTGAAGRIGSAFVRDVDERYVLRLADCHIPTYQHDHESVLLHIEDLESCQAACRGMDVVMHLAGDPSPQADFYDSLLQNNIVGTYNLFRAAKDQGCRRVIFASSIWTVGDYTPERPVMTDVPVRPPNMYAVSKCFGEAVAYYFATAEGLSSIAIRIGSYESDWIWRQRDDATLRGFISQRDMCQLLTKCIEISDVPFAIVHGISDNQWKRLDITTTRELLGYQPQDDAFQLFETYHQHSIEEENR